MPVLAVALLFAPLALSGCDGSTLLATGGLVVGSGLVCVSDLSILSAEKGAVREAGLGAGFFSLGIVTS